MFNKLKSIWDGLLNTRFSKKKRKVRRNTLCENIFDERMKEYWGRIDIDIG